MKKILSVLMISSILLSGVIISQTTKKVFASNGIAVDAKAAILMDYNSGEVIYKHNENAKLPIASMCKIMTLLLAFEEIDKGNLSLDGDIQISEYSASMGGSQAFLNKNDSYKLSTLLKTIIVASANDSCVAVAEAICGNVDTFVDRMNNRAKELGMTNTAFTNCTGLPKVGQYSTSNDVAIMTRELLRHKDYYLYSKIWLEDLVHSDGRKTTLTNTNKLVRFYNGCDGGKTGYTTEAGHCLSCTAKKGEMRLISVIIGAKDSKIRFKDTSTLLDFGFNNYENKRVISNDKPIEQIVKVKKGKTDVSIIPENNVYVFGKKNSKLENVQFKYELDENKKAPIKKGEVIGIVYVINNGNVVGSTNLLANNDVDKSSYFDNVKRVINNWRFV